MLYSLNELLGSIRMDRLETRGLTASEDTKDSARSVRNTMICKRETMRKIHNITMSESTVPNPHDTNYSGGVCGLRFLLFRTKSKSCAIFLGLADMPHSMWPGSHCPGNRCSRHVEGVTQHWTTHSFATSLPAPPRARSRATPKKTKDEIRKLQHTQNQADTTPPRTSFYLRHTQSGTEQNQRKS